MSTYHWYIKWELDKDRGFVAANFIGTHPSIIVHPIKVFNSEYHHFPSDPILLEQGLDIGKWSNDLKEIKDTWLNKANQIINHAFENGTLNQNEKGDFIVDAPEKEVLLTSLDLRLFDNPDIDLFIRPLAKVSFG